MWQIQDKDFPLLLVTFSVCAVAVSPYLYLHIIVRHFVCEGFCIKLEKKNYFFQLKLDIEM